jgi:Tfp pilus assembly protein PilO
MRRRGPLVAGIAMGVVALLLVVLFVLPKMSQVGAAKDELVAAQGTEDSLLVQLGVLQDAEATAPETERAIAEIEDEIPPTTDLPTLFRLLQGAADRSAVDFFSFSPGTPLLDPSGTFSVVPSQVTVIGNYFAADEFFFLLETLQRASKVTSWTIAPFATAEGSSVDEDSLQMQMTVEFYTTDISAGPGSVPGETQGAPVGATGATGPAGTTGVA